MISDNMTHELTYDKYSLIMEITFLRERSCVTNKKIQKLIFATIILTICIYVFFFPLSIFI